MLSLVEQRCRYVEAFRPTFGQRHIDIFVINLRIEKSSDHIQMIDVPAMFSDQGDEISKWGEFPNSGIGFSDGGLFVAFND